MEKRRKPPLDYSVAFVISLVLHLAVFGMLLLPKRAVVSRPQPMVIELVGIVSDTQSVKKDVAQTAAQPAKNLPPPPEPPPQAEPPPAKPVEQPVQRTVERPHMAEKAKPLPPARTLPKPGSTQNVAGAKERDEARRLTQEELDRAYLQQYVTLLSRRIDANLVYPNEARQAGLEGTATVSFAIQADGQIGPDSLHIAVSSGQPILDAGALNTVRSSVPFDPPPHPITVSIAIVFRRKS